VDRVRRTHLYAGVARRLTGSTVLAALVLGVAAVLGVGAAHREERRPQGGPPVAVAPPTAPRATTAPGPRVVVDHIAFGPKRRAETAAYAQRHYGRATAVLQPTMVVLHYTESDTYASVRSLFAADRANNGELPGVCSHYVVDQDGTVYEVVPPTVLCRHTIGLNDKAIGVELVQASHGHDARWGARQVLARRVQVQAAVGLVRMLQQRFGIPDDAVIGHAMANSAKGFRDLPGWRNDHADWQAPEVSRFRALLAAG